MANEGGKDISRLFREGTPIDEALAAAVKEAVLRHKQQGQPLAVWRGGRTIWIRPEDVAPGDAATKAERE